MSREKSPPDCILLHTTTPTSLATPEVSSACKATNRKKVVSTGLMGVSERGTLSMREFFEAGGRAYEVYLSYQDRQRLLPAAPVLPPRCPLSSPTKDNRKPLIVDQLPVQLPDVSAKTSGISPPVLTVVHVTATSVSPTTSRPVFTQTGTGQRSRGLFPVTSQGSKDTGVTSPPRAYVAADVIDRVIASRLRALDNGESSSLFDTFGGKKEKRNVVVTERPRKSIITPLATMSETSLTTSQIASSSSTTVSSTPSSSAELPRRRTTSWTSPMMENVEGRSLNEVDLNDNSYCLKRILTTDEDPQQVVDLSRKRRKSADDNKQCEAGNQSNVCRRQKATPIDGQKTAKIEADGKNVTRPSIAGVVPKVVNQSATIFSDVTQWSIDQVVRFVANVQGCREYAEVFRHEEIDGACLIRLSESHLLNVIQMKLGPALRLRQAISNLCSIDAS